MKQNGNDKKTGEYYLGLDVGTNSVGWAVTDPEYRVLKFHGNAMWGARLFDEAQDASGRRSSRVARRRLARRNQRLRILELLFAEEIAKVDPLFLRRMEESALWLDDKTDRSCRFSLFNDPAFTDKDYHRRYPTIYHLRQELMQSDEPHDIRLVYLALHHILKSRGHFLYTSSGEDDQIIPVETVLAELQQTLEEAYSVSFSIADEKAFVSALARNDIGVGEKQKLLKAAWGGHDEDDAPVRLSSVIDLLAGKSGIKLSLLFADESLDAEEISKVSLKNDLDELFDSLSASLGDRVDLLLQLKDVYDTARLTQMLKGHATLSEAKIALYEKNRADLRLFKAWVRRKLPKHYKEIFSLKKDKLNNYAAYSGYQSKSGSYSCTQEAFANI